MRVPEKSFVSERRSSPRQPVAYRMDVLDPEGNAGCLLDISTTGMRVYFRRGLDLQGTGELRLEFPRWLELGSGITVPGRFVWVRNEEEGGCECGFAFGHLSRKDHDALEQLIHRLAAVVASDRAHE